MRLLDLFCGAGGAAIGYSRAGFDEIVGVDIEPQPHYPFEFVQADALEVLEYLFGEWHRPAIPGWLRLAGDFDAIHASPPCQEYSLLKNFHGHRITYPDLVAPTRKLLESTGLPYVIENVPHAPIQKHVMLCGSMFGLPIRMHRHFELGNWFTLQPKCGKHYKTQRHGGPWVLITGHETGGKKLADAKGIGWVRTRAEVTQMIPPAYTQFIGERFLEHLKVSA